MGFIIPYRYSLLRVWDEHNVLVTEKYIYSHPPADIYIKPLCFSFDKNLLAIADNKQKVYLWNIKTDKMITLSAEQIQAGAFFTFMSGDFSPDNKLLAASFYSRDGGGIIIWNVETDSIYCKDGIGPVTQITFSPDGKIIAYSTRDTIFLMDVDSRKIINTIDSTQCDLPECIKFSSSGKRIAAGAPYSDILSLWGARSSHTDSTSESKDMSQPQAKISQ